MKQLIYSLPVEFRKPELLALPGIEKFGAIFAMYGDWVIPADRTGVMNLPIHIKPLYPIPTFRTFTKTFAELCDERATEILSRSERLNAPIYIMYSGGIDSTCVVVSMLKNATAAQRKKLTILLSDQSIQENPKFYDEHLKGKIQIGPSMSFSERLGTNDILLSGEHNDMIMGSEKIGKLMMRYGPHSIYERYNRTMMIEFYAGMVQENTNLSTFYIDMFEKICAQAPMPLTTNMDFLWWINFAIKWQSCYAYILLLTPEKQTHLINQEYLDSRFVSFYNTDDFQLWSMNNLDKRIKDTWKSYKWVPKEIIYSYNKDAEYRDHKMKRGSLTPLTMRLHHFKYVDDQWNFYDALDPREFYNPNNDFK
jgi:hypothetical protein